MNNDSYAAIFGNGSDSISINKNTDTDYAILSDGEQDSFFTPSEERVKELIEYNRQRQQENFIYSKDIKILKFDVNNRIELLLYQNENPTILVSSEDKELILPLFIKDIPKCYIDNKVSVYFYEYKEDVCIPIYFLKSVSKKHIYCLPRKYITSEDKNFNEMEFGACTTFISYSEMKNN